MSRHESIANVITAHLLSIAASTRHALHINHEDHPLGECPTCGRLRELRRQWESEYAKAEEGLSGDVEAREREFFSHIQSSVQGFEEFRQRLLDAHEKSGLMRWLCKDGHGRICLYNRRSREMRYIEPDFRIYAS